MKNNITKTQNINFRDYMAMPSGMDFESLFGTLNDHGISVATTADDFLEAEDEEDVMHNMNELGMNLEFFALYLQAKAKGFEALRDEGIAAIYASAECSGPLSFEYEGKVVDGEWCSKDGVLYITYDDMIDTTAASVARDKRSRKKADIATAEFWLTRMIDRKTELHREAA